MRYAWARLLSWLAANGVISKKYLNADLDYLIHAILEKNKHAKSQASK